METQPFGLYEMPSLTGSTAESRADSADLDLGHLRARISVNSNLHCCIFEKGIVTKSDPDPSTELELYNFS